MKTESMVTLKTYSPQKTEILLGDFFNRVRHFAKTISPLYPESSTKVWIDTQWECGIDPGDPIYSSKESFSARFSQKPLASVSDIELVPQALGFARVIRNASAPHKWISSLRSDPSQALRGVLETNQFVNRAWLSLVFGDAQKKKLEVNLRQNSQGHACGLEFPNCDDFLAHAQTYISTTVHFANTNIIIVDRPSWRRRFSEEFQKKLSSRFDVAVGWRTFVRNLEIVEQLLELECAVPYLDGALLSFGDRPTDTDSIDNIEKMQYVAELLMTSA